MNSFKVAHFDDEKNFLLKVKSWCISLERTELEIYNQKIQHDDYDNPDSLKEAILNNVLFDLVILDMYDGDHKAVGEEILDLMKNLGNVTPVIIFTIGSNAQNAVDYERLREDYPFIVCAPIIKGGNGDKMKEVILNLILEKKVVADIFHFDEDDIYLSLELKSIGRSGIDKIVHKVKMRYGVTSEVELQRISSGFSGASLFRVLSEDKSFLLKVSKDKLELRKEYQNSINQYKKLPASMRIDIGDSNELEIDDLLAFSIEEVKGGTTFFSWLNEVKDMAKVEQFCQDLFTDGLKEFYNENQGKEAGFKGIFEKFDRVKFAKVRKAYEELKPILGVSVAQFEFGDIKNIVVNNSYKSLDSNDRLEKRKVSLSHGDFHGNNVMIRNNSPVIIDAGGMKFAHVYSDYTRLIVHLFIEGIDRGKFEYFDIAQIPRWFENAKNIIDLKQIKIDELEPLGYVYAINWMVRNIEELFPDNFQKYEYQLCLLNEFLQISYRNYSTPASKRSLALFCADYCLRAAVISVDG